MSSQALLVWSSVETTNLLQNACKLELPWALSGMDSPRSSCDLALGGMS